jgi:hypothetical protein
MRTSERTLGTSNFSSPPFSLPGVNAVSQHGHWLTPNEVSELAGELAKGRVPADLEYKLERLRKGGLGWQFLEKQCRVIIGLIQASLEGSFRTPARAELESLLWVLAYVRKDEDAIPDYHAGGYVDDQEEMRRVTNAIEPLLQEFKAWRLQHKVPALWQE